MMMRPVYVAVLAFVAVVSAHPGHHDAPADVAMPSAEHPFEASAQQAALNKKLSGLPTHNELLNEELGPVVASTNGAIFGHGYSEDENSQITYEDMAHPSVDTDEVSSKAPRHESSVDESATCDVIDSFPATAGKSFDDAGSDESEPMVEDEDEIVQADKPIVNEDVQKASIAADLSASLHATFGDAINASHESHIKAFVDSIYGDLLKASSAKAGVEDPVKNAADCQLVDEDDEFCLHDDDDDEAYLDDAYEADLVDEDDDGSEMNDEDWVAYYITHMIEEHPDDLTDAKVSPHFAALQRLMPDKDISASIPDAMAVLAVNKDLWETFLHKADTHGEDDKIKHYLGTLTPKFISQIVDPEMRKHVTELQAAMSGMDIAQSAQEALSILELNPRLRANILNDAKAHLEAAHSDPGVDRVIKFLKEMTPDILAEVNDPQYLQSFAQLQALMPGMDISESIDVALEILDEEQELGANLLLDAEHYYTTPKSHERGRYQNHHEDPEEDQHPGVSDEQVLEYFLDYMTPETIKEIDDPEVSAILTKLQSLTPDNNIPESFQEVMTVLNANAHLRSKLLPFARKWSPYLLNDTQCLKRYLAMLSERRLKVINDADLWDHVKGLRFLMPGKEITEHVDEAFAILGQHPDLKAALLKDSEYKGHCRHNLDLDAIFNELQLGRESDSEESEPSRKKRKASMK